MNGSKRGPGRPKLYSGSEPGAPKITVRFSQDVYEWLKSREEGVRSYIERLIREDWERLKDSQAPVDASTLQ